MNSTINEMMQLIYYDLTFNEQFEEYVERTGMKSLGKDFNTVAIIGCQSSGKSTLLNKLFDTNFEVMSDDKGRGQTTQGIWVAMSKEYRCMILDCEGTDSKERGEDRFKFEHCSSLFALAMADVLIINMWTNDVGRYTAANYGVLKIVFEMNLKLFQQECAKKILIVLRDFDEVDNVKEKITELILQDIYTIWKDIKKPEKYKDYSPARFFEFEFTTLPHKFYFEDRFNQEAGIMRQRLLTNSSDYLFSHVISEKNIPIDGLSLYCRQMWSDIISDKDLNIPSQKEMLAKFKCNEIKQQALFGVESAIEEFITESGNKIMDNFKLKCEQIQKSALDVYDATAKNYLNYVYEAIRQHLLQLLAERLNQCFENQTKKMIPIAQKNMRQELKRELKNSMIIINIQDVNFFQVATTIKQMYLNNLIRQIEIICFFKSWRITVDEYEQTFDEIIDSERKTSLEEKQNECIKKLKTECSESLTKHLEDLTTNFWYEYNRELVTTYYRTIYDLKTRLTQYYSMDEREFVPYAITIEDSLHTSMKKEFSKRLKELPSFVMEAFRRKFWTEDGIPRAWRKMSEGEIESLFEVCRKENYYAFEIFKVFKIIKSPLKCKFSIKIDSEYKKFTEERFTEFLDRLKFILDDSQNNPLEALLPENELRSLRTRYEENINSIYEEAKAKHANVVKQTVPIWAWFLIIYLGYEDVMNMVSSYWIIPVILLLSLYGVLSATGMGHLPNTIFNSLKNTVFSKLLNMS